MLLCTAALPAQLSQQVREQIAGTAADQGVAAAELLDRLRSGAEQGPEQTQAIHDLALALAERRLQLAATLPDAESLTRIAIEAARTLGRADLAVDAARRASTAQARADDLPLARRLGELGLAPELDADKSVLRLHLASVALAAGELRRAEILLDEVETALPALPDRVRPQYELALREQQGRLALDLGVLDRAAPCFAAVAAVLGREHPRVRLWELELALAAEDFAHAAGLADELAKLERPPLPLHELQLRAAIARQRLAHDDPAARDAVRTLLEAALARAQRPATRARLQLRLGRWHLEAGALVVAREYSDSAATLLAAANGAELVQDACASAVLAAQILLRSDPADASAVAAARDRLHAAQQQQLERWRSHPVRTGGFGYLNHVFRRDLIATLIACELRLRPEHPEHALRHLLETQVLGTAARRLKLAAPTPEQVRRELVPDRGGLLLYLPSSVGSHLFVLTAEGCEHYALAPLGPVRERVRTLRTLLQRTPATMPDPRREQTIREHAEFIATALLPPAVAVAMAQWSDVVVVGRDLLAELPFEALPGVREPWLGLDFAISYLPSVPVGISLAQHRDPRPGNRLLFLAATEPVDPFPRLPLSHAELVQWSTPFVEHRLLHGAEVTRAAVLAAAQPEFGTWCLLAHGADELPQIADPRTASLVLAAAAPDDAARLRCSDIEQLAFPPDAVVLASCGSGRGAARRGDDQAMHVAGAFLAAGTRAVIGASTDLELATAQRLLPVLLRELAAGTPVAEALRRARVELVQVHGLGDPAHHATLHVLGLGRAAIPVPPRTDSEPRRNRASVWWLTALALPLLGLLAWSRARRTRVS